MRDTNPYIISDTTTSEDKEIHWTLPYIFPAA
jgi:hypothetical protein